MGRRTVRIAMNGVTGRMGYVQHLVRSILALQAQGGLVLTDGAVVWPEPVLVGRNPAKLEALASRHGITRWTTSLPEVLADPGVEVYLDAQVTQARFPAVAAAIEAGKAVYMEKPVAACLTEALELARAAAAKGVPNGVVQDKIFLPGLRKLRRVVAAGTLGRLLAVRGEFGYWVFEGSDQPAQRPS